MSSPFVWDRRLPVLSEGLVPGCQGCLFFDEIKWELVDQGHANHVIPYDLRIGSDMYNFLPHFAVVPAVCKEGVKHEIHNDPKKGGFFAIEDFQVKDGEHGRAISLSPSGICLDKIKEWITFCDLIIKSSARNTRLSTG